MTPKQAKALIGRRVIWDVVIDPHRLNGIRERTGTIEDVRGKNVMIDGDWKWLPDLSNLREVTQ